MKIKLQINRTVLLACIALLIMFFNSCKYQEITVGTPTGLKVKEIGIQNVTLQIDLPVNNPNNFSFNLNKIELDVYIGDIKVGKVTKTDKVKIASRSDDIYPVDLEFKPADLMGNSFKIVSELSKRNVDLAVKGKVKVSKIIVSKNIKVDSKEKVKIY